MPTQTVELPKVAREGMSAPSVISDSSQERSWYPPYAARPAE
ncbi:hypothetical protein [Sphaerisporangium fuscum]|nr:hypothetical protein [Sphaerisporangium fuscum]